MARDPASHDDSANAAVRALRDQVPVGRALRDVCATRPAPSGTLQNFGPPPSPGPGSDTTMAFVPALFGGWLSLLATSSPSVPTRTAWRNADSWLVSIDAVNTGTVAL